MSPMQSANMQEESVGDTAGETQSDSRLNMRIMLEFSEKDFAIE